MDASPSLSPTANPIIPQKKSKTKLIVLSIIGGIIVLLAIITIAIVLFVKLLFGSTAAVVDVNNKYITALQSSDYVAAEQYESTDFRNTTTSDQVANLWKQFSLSGYSYAVKERNIQKNSSSPESAAIVYKFTKSGERDMYVRFVSVKNGDVWQVQNFYGSTSSLPATIE